MAPDGSELDRFKVGTLVGRDLVDAVRSGALPIRHPATGTCLNRDAPWAAVEGSVVSVADLRVFSAELKVDVDVLEGGVPAGAQNGARRPDLRDTEPVSRFKAQEHAILQKLKELGYDPQSLPKAKPGRPGVKKEVRDAFGKDRMWSGETVLDKAWERLRKAGLIKDAP